jgi:hypothetical protein
MNAVYNIVDKLKKQGKLGKTKIDINKLIAEENPQMNIKLNGEK